MGQMGQIFEKKNQQMKLEPCCKQKVSSFNLHSFSDSSHLCVCLQHSAWGSFPGFTKWTPIRAFLFLEETFL